MDWASDHHDIIVVDDSGRVVADFQIEHTAEAWRAWRERTAAWPDLAVAVETSFGIVVENLLLDFFVLHPFSKNRREKATTDHWINAAPGSPFLSSPKPSPKVASE